MSGKSPVNVLRRCNYHRYLPLYLIMVPSLLVLIIYRYIPMGGLILIFKDYRITRGIFKSAWVGLDNIRKLMNSPFFGMVLKNTVIISCYKLLFSFPAPIILALMLNSFKRARLRRIFQTVYYLPHFISWVVIGNLLFAFFAPTSGIVSLYLQELTGFVYNPLLDPSSFRGFLVATDIWKEVGWSSIIYLAAITGIDPTIYEAAIVDGTNKKQQLIYITIPSLMPTIMTMFLLRVGHILNAGFEQIFILQNPMVYNVSEILDTYIYKVSFLQGQYTMGAVAGIFKSVIGLIMVVSVNRIAREFDQQVI